MALFVAYPNCNYSMECCDAMVTILNAHYNIKLFTQNDITPAFFKNIDIVTFPGGILDSDTHDDLFDQVDEETITNYIDGGGHYLGICMGAYWAGKHYFDILKGIDAVQYIKRPKADIRRSYGTIAPVIWNKKEESIYFYDGTAFLGKGRFKTIATYANGDPMAIIQKRIGLIGCHPESLKHWYNKKHLKPYWHEGEHHNLLLNFIDKLIER